METNSYFCVVLCLILSQAAYAQNTFNVMYDENNLVESLTAILPTTSNDFLVVGRVRRPLSYEDTVTIRKLSSTGELLWVKKHFLSIGYGHWASDIFPLSNGHYVVSGSITNDTTFYSDNPYLLEIDSAGNFVDFHHYGTEFEEVGASAARAVDGGFYLGGWSDRYASAANHNSDAYVIKTDSAYTMQWIQYYQRSKANTAYGIYATPDTGCVILTQNVDCCYENDASLIKLDKYGSVEWEHTYLPPAENYGTAVTGTQDGGYIIALHRQSSNYDAAYIAKTDRYGEIEWQKNLNFGYLYQTPRAIRQLPDGSYALVGSVRDMPATTGADSPGYGWLLKLSPSGEVLWSRRYGHKPDIWQNYLYNMNLCSDGGFALCGMIIDSLPGRNNAWAIKTDSLGNDCYSQPYLYSDYYGPNPINLAWGDTATLHPQAFGGCPPYTYTWSGADSVYLDNPYIQYPRFVPPAVGSYTFYLSIADSDTLNRTDTLNIEVINDTTVLDVVAPDGPSSSREARLSLYPNPASQIAQVQYSPSYSCIYAQIVLLNHLGQIQWQQKLKHPDSNGNFSTALRLSDLPSGMYFVHCTDSNGQKCNQKLMVVK